jgi:hypothetical protein
MALFLISRPSRYPQLLDLQVAALEALRKREWLALARLRGGGAKATNWGGPLPWTTPRNERVVSVNLAGESQPAASEILQSIGLSLALR